MLRATTVSPHRAWYTWSDRPAEMVFLPLGVRVTPLAFAGSTGAATLFPPGPAVTFGRHDLAATDVGLTLRHAGTELDWRWWKPDPFVVAGRWQAPTLGEWGLRFWVTLCLSTEDGTPVRWLAEPGAALVTLGHRTVALAAAEAPVQVTGHASVAAVAAHYEQHGYFHTAARSGEAPVLALRFNLEMSRANRFAAAVADRPDLAAARARAAATAPEPPPTPPEAIGRDPAAREAVRDVMAWNTVWDPVNARPYTSISRNWNGGKFGGFGVWLDDQFYAALMTSLFDAEVARENLVAALASATPEGNFACLLTANDAWVDRTQIPVGGFVTWAVYRQTASRPILTLMRDALERNNAWWWRHRDPHGRGLVCYGTSDLGGGLYKGTSFGARNESSMDNSPIHDEATYDPATRTLDCEDVGLNSLLALDAEMLGRIAGELGDAAAAAAHMARADAHKARIRDELWDGSRGLFANRLWSGRFVRSVGPTSFFPFAAGIPTPAQAERLLAHLDDPATFGGAPGLPSVSRNDPAFGDDVYWRGRIWPPLNFWVWQGLLRAGHATAARTIEERGAGLARHAWRSRICPENYSAVADPQGRSPDADTFYSWGALMPFMSAWDDASWLTTLPAAL